jgi:hypothetical protein
MRSRQLPMQKKNCRLKNLARQNASDKIVVKMHTRRRDIFRTSLPLAIAFVSLSADGDVLKRRRASRRVPYSTDACQTQAAPEFELEVLFVSARCSRIERSQWFQKTKKLLGKGYEIRKRHEDAGECVHAGMQTRKMEWRKRNYVGS